MVSFGWCKYIPLFSIIPWGKFYLHDPLVYNQKRRSEQVSELLIEKSKALKNKKDYVFAFLLNRHFFWRSICV